MEDKRTSLVALLVGFASRLRYPVLATVTALLFLADLAIPDLIPFVDEILLGLLTILLGTRRRRRKAPGGEGDGGDPRAGGGAPPRGTLSAAR